jgi:hypothetical protein
MANGFGLFAIRLRILKLYFHTSPAVLMVLLENVGIVLQNRPRPLPDVIIRRTSFIYQSPGTGSNTNTGGRTSSLVPGRDMFPAADGISNARLMASLQHGVSA